MQNVPGAKIPGRFLYAIENGKTLFAAPSLHEIFMEIAAGESETGLEIGGAVILLHTEMLHAGFDGHVDDPMEVHIAVADLGDVSHTPAFLVAMAGHILQVQDIDPAGQLFNPRAYVAARVLHPVGIQHEGRMLRIQAFHSISIAVRPFSRRMNSWLWL